MGPPVPHKAARPRVLACMQPHGVAALLAQASITRLILRVRASGRESRRASVRCIVATFPVNVPSLRWNCKWCEACLGVSLPRIN